MMKTSKTLKNFALAGALLSAQAFAGQAEIDRIETAAATLDVEALTQLPASLKVMTML